MNIDTARFEAISTVISNLAMAGLLIQERAGAKMLEMHRMSDFDLGLEMVASRLLLDKSLEIMAERNKN